MKRITALALLALSLSTSAFAEQSHEVIETQANLSVANLTCVTHFDPVRTTTSLTGFSGRPLEAMIQNNPLEMTHPEAKLEGCDMAVLSRIVESSRMHFGFLLRVPTKITKETGASFVNGFKKCVALYEETLELTLAPGVVVQSQTGDLREKNDCTR